MINVIYITSEFSLLQLFHFQILNLLKSIQLKVHIYKSIFSVKYLLRVNDFYGVIDKNISIILTVIKLYILKSNRKNKEMTRNNSCCHFLNEKKNGSYTDSLNHILWVRRVFDFIVDADPRTLKYLTSIPYLKISLVKLIILCLKAVLDHYPCSLAQYIFDIY